jgi:hypothetical protein
MQGAFVTAAVVWGALGIGLGCVLARILGRRPADSAQGFEPKPAPSSSETG